MTDKNNWTFYTNLQLDSIAINVKSHKLLMILMNENPRLNSILLDSHRMTAVYEGIKSWVMEYMDENPNAYKYYKNSKSGMKLFSKLKWSDFAAIRILDYIKYAGTEYKDQNLRGRTAVSNPFKVLWLAVNEGAGGGKPDFFEDMIELFRQFRGKDKRVVPSFEKVKKWMDKHPSGLDERIIKLRKQNKDRIINIFIKKIDEKEIAYHKRFNFDDCESYEQKYMAILDWWETSEFHLAFAIRKPELLNEMLDFSLEKETMDILFNAKKAGIPFFVNPYYLSLLHVREPYFAVGADLALRDYILYSKSLVDEFGNIVAWEKEDIVKPGEPNAAGWILPTKHNLHRRYPEVAILIPDTMGRACAGLCASCQRMYDFQRGYLNFNLNNLKPKMDWATKLELLLEYFENDSQLRDILITGGDALMSSDESLKKILDSILQMAKRKIEANRNREKKYAEMQRIRLGTRLPAYLPQRITPELVMILKNFKIEAQKLGFKQFIIQTHFQSTMEITLRSKKAIESLISAGWLVTNQHVFTAAASRRGHNAKLRKELNDIGVVSYYTFTVKGYMENSGNFTPNARAVQEQLEEKNFGLLSEESKDNLYKFHDTPENIIDLINEIRQKDNITFLATDRNVLNLPGVGKSLSFRVIGITRYGRRILKFSHDYTRNHSPIINKMKDVLIIESKSISTYIREMDGMGENIEDYKSLYGYSIGETEPRNELYRYHEYPFEVTDDMTNLQI
ncbi:MAG: KamA family protein [Candidatus Delongbacteria bacterium]|nr:KamA family protein [Candidatus Delongbacteria bacterium]MBN2833651.1 KamA family protein [Candidatus Delongbacteria bacterium]